MSTAIDEKTLAILRSFPNPFADGVCPQFTDPTFRDIHIQEIFAEPREQLFKAIDSYRVANYTSNHSLPLSAAITIIGPRGAGKTHLLESIQHRFDGQPQLIVVRQNESFDEDLSFEEYLYQLLIQSLLEPHASSGVRYFDAIATQLTRLILLQTVGSLSAIEQLIATNPGGKNWYRLLCWGNGNDILSRFNMLAKDLEKPASAEELRHLEIRHQLKEARLADLAMTYLQRTETGAESLSIIRRELYAAMIRATMSNQSDAFDQFLEADYRPVNKRAIFRTEVVRQLLFALVEVCALVQLPIVFAFDNLEGFLAPGGKFLGRKAASFLEGIAQTIDHFRGLLFLVFAEEGMFTEMRQHAGTFARPRLDRGVSFPGMPPLDRVHLSSPRLPELKKLILNRMCKIRDALAASALPEWFPFPLEFVTETGNSGQAIRGKIEALRAKYDALVFGSVSSPAPPLGKLDGDKDKELALFAARVWKLKQGEAGRKLDVSVLGNGQDLAQGLGELLKTGLAVLNPAATVHPFLEVGDDPRYGRFCLVECPSNGTIVRIAIGLLLASGKGMPMDLQSKFAAFHDEKIRASRLVVLWSTNNTSANLVDALPERTRQVWDDAKADIKTTLRKVGPEDLRLMLAFPLWRDEVRKENPDFPEVAIRTFVTDNCQAILTLVPPIGKQE